MSAVSFHAALPVSRGVRGRVSTRVRAAVQNFSYMDYYDAESAACVERLYEQDFALFGFPRFDERPAATAARSPAAWIIWSPPW